MRLQRLELLRYGCFTDVALELPARIPDLHILCGLNEAGKSTALAAIEDFLFGIPHHSPYSFLHDNRSLAIGATVEGDGQVLAARRRKGNKDTLLTPDGIPLPAGEASLAPFLAGADRDFLRRVFCLDHARLREGGREILQAQDEVGQMLFAAGSGLPGLRAQLDALNQEADALWSPRRAAHRQYYQAEDRYSVAAAAVREHTVRTRTWQDLKRALEEAQEQYAQLEAEIEQLSAETRKLGRIRRVYRDVQRYAGLGEQLTTLGSVVRLPEDAGATLATAQKEEADLLTRARVLAEQLQRARQERTELVCDEQLLVRAEEIRELDERRSRVRGAKSDLPERRAELAGLEAQVQHLARELGWDPANLEQMAGQIPARGQVARVRALLTQRGAVQEALTNAQTALTEAEGDAAEARTHLDGIPSPMDVTQLAAVTRAVREQGDLAARIAGAEAEVEKARATVQQSLASLHPPVADAAILAVLPVPPRAAVQHHRDSLRDLHKRLQANEEGQQAAQRSLARHQQSRQRIVGDEHAVSPPTLRHAREHRDAGWSLVRRQYVEGQPVPPEQISAYCASQSDIPGAQLPNAYEAAVRHADVLADQRFDHAKVTADLAAVDRQIAEQEEGLSELRHEAQHLQDRRQRLSEAWLECWAGVPFTLLDPDGMLEWLDARTEVLDAAERQAAAGQSLEALHREEAQARERILAEVAGVTKAQGGPEPGSSPEPVRLAGLPVAAVLEYAAALQQEHERRAQVREQLTENVRRTGVDTRRRRAVADGAGQAWEDWQTRWAAAVAQIGLDGSRPEVVAAQADTIDALRETTDKARELGRGRIAKMEAFIAAFDQDVASQVSAIAPDLLRAPTEEAALQMDQRLAVADRVRADQQRKDTDIAVLQNQMEEAELGRRQIRETIRHLQEQAGVQELTDLQAAIERSDSLRVLERELAQVGEILAAQGDGLAVADLQTECGAADLDQAAVREEAMQQELQERRERLMQAREARTQAHQQFAQVGGADGAARAESDRQAALAEMGGVAAQYCRVRACSLLLQWAVDRYRLQKQAPLLRRSSELFEALTTGSFAGLQLAFDEQDRPQLAGLRPDGSRVGVGGMSSGTLDQLYLALRIASVEDYLDRAPPLPFVADDLFINFDDGRATAGMHALAALAKRTQVLFFTHHQHLVELTRSALPDVAAIRLPDPARHAIP